MTVKPAFTSSISLGNWITIIALVASAAVGWGVMKTDQASNRLTVTRIEAELADVKIRIRALENQDARTQERHDHLMSALASIDGRLERMERSGD